MTRSLHRPRWRDFLLRAVIFANGILSESTNATQLIQPGDVLIAADGGARHCLALNLTPQAVIGDFDSLETDELALLNNAGAQVIRHPARKDFTDLELAIEHALTIGADNILILGALGRRWDQTLANLLLPAAESFSGATIRLVDEFQEIIYIRSGDSVEITGNPGDTASLIPLAGNARGITTSGLEYPLEKGTLHFGSTRGISNVLQGNRATVSVEEGLLLCVLIHTK